MKYKVFVYGTLKTGGSNSTLLWSSRYVGPEVIEGFIMYDLGAYPAVVRTDNKSDMVGGEVWELSDGTMEVIDKLEGWKGENNSSNLYNKEVVQTNYGEAFVYSLNIVEPYRLKYPIIEDGNWETGSKGVLLS